jgi:hypothetical protein
VLGSTKRSVISAGLAHSGQPTSVSTGLTPGQLLRPLPACSEQDRAALIQSRGLFRHGRAAGQGRPHALQTASGASGCWLSGATATEPGAAARSSFQEPRIRRSGHPSELRRPRFLRYRCGVQRCPDRSAAGMIVTSLYVPVRLVGRSFARVAPTLAPADRASLLNLDHGQNEQARSTLPRLRRHRFPGADPAMGRDHTGRPPSCGRQAIPSHHLSTLSARRVFQRPGVPTPPSRSK